jgi:beta-N-acetylhexosaminidase
MNNPSAHLSPANLLVTDVIGLELTPEDRDIIRHPATGAIILFTRNYRDPQQAQALIESIKAVDHNIYIAVDQEGGRVQRFKQGFCPLPAMRVIGARYDNDPQDGLAIARQCGFLMAYELRALGVDISFAPVLDLFMPASQIIADRAFHASPDIISLLSKAFIAGMNAAGMGATGKHFPGHGGVVSDSHLETPEDLRTLEELMTADLAPYRQLNEHIDGIMTAHIKFSKIDDDLPTYSKFWLQTMLRERLKFTGLVFSDDLMMVGATTIVEPVERAARALQAGCDMLICCNNRDASGQILDSLHGWDKARIDLLHHRQRRLFAKGDEKPIQAPSVAEVDTIRAKIAGLCARQM